MTCDGRGHYFLTTEKLTVEVKKRGCSIYVVKCSNAVLIGICTSLHLTSLTSALNMIN